MFNTVKENLVGAFNSCAHAGCVLLDSNTAKTTLTATFGALGGISLATGVGVPLGIFLVGMSALSLVHTASKAIDGAHRSKIAELEIAAPTPPDNAGDRLRALRHAATALLDRKTAAPLESVAPVFRYSYWKSSVGRMAVLF